MDERVGLIASAVTVIVLAGCTTYGCTQLSRQWHEFRTSCVEAGGTWVNYNRMCIAKGVDAEICRGGSCQ